GVDDALVLEAVVLGEEVAPPLERRQAVLLVVPELGEPPADARAGGDAVEVGEGQPVLGRHPGAGLRRVEVLEPAVGAGDGDAGGGVAGVGARRGGVGGGGGGGGGGGDVHARRLSVPRPEGRGAVGRGDRRATRATAGAAQVRPAHRGQ